MLDGGLYFQSARVFTLIMQQYLFMCLLTGSCSLLLKGMADPRNQQK